MDLREQDRATRRTARKERVSETRAFRLIRRFRAKIVGIVEQMSQEYQHKTLRLMIALKARILRGLARLG